MYSPPTTPPHLLTLVLLSGLSVVSLNMFLPSLNNISSDFQADYSIVNLSIAGYAGVTAALLLIMGPLSDRFGRRPVILGGLIIFSVASLGCLLAADVWTFLFFRMMQGAIVSGYAVSLAVIKDSTAERGAASLIGYLSMAWAIGPMLGPAFGGILDEFFGWRTNFLAFCGFGMIALGLCWMDLGETNKNPSETIVKQFRAYPELLRSKQFWGYASCMAFSTGGFYAFLGGVPLVATTLFDVPPSAIGFYIGTITAGFIVGSFLSGKFASRYKLTTMMIVGRVVACSGMSIGLILLFCGIVQAFTFFGACTFYGIGNGLTLPSSNVGAMSVRPALAGSASGLSGALAVAGGATISAITGAVLTADNAGYMLLVMMLFSSALGLMSAIYTRWLDRQDNMTATSDI